MNGADAGGMHNVRQSCAEALWRCLVGILPRLAAAGRHKRYSRGIGPVVAIRTACGGWLTPGVKPGEVQPLREDVSEPVLREGRSDRAVPYHVSRAGRVRVLIPTGVDRSYPNSKASCEWHRGKPGVQTGTKKELPGLKVTLEWSYESA